MTTLKYLNGWQRLWILVSAISGIVIIGLSLVSLPSPASVNSDTILNRLSTDSLIGLAETGEKMHQWYQIISDPTFQRESSKTIQDVATNFFNQEIAADKEFQKLSPDVQNKIKMHFFKTMEAMKATVYEKKRANRNRIIMHIGASLASWLTLSASLYGLGYATGWVYRGFKKKP